jgi:hypothetical protein
LAAVNWEVNVQKIYIKGDHQKWSADGNININREGMDHYVHRKGCLRAIRRMQKELNMFEAAMTTAFEDVEAANNAES